MTPPVLHPEVRGPYSTLVCTQTTQEGDFSTQQGKKKKKPKRLQWNPVWLRYAAVGNRTLVEQVPGTQGCVAIQPILC